MDEPTQSELIAGRVRSRCEEGRAVLLEHLLASPYTPHYPTAHQAEFLLCDTLEAMYGGAAGGGKSDALLMAALMYADVPGYSAVIIRRTYPDLAQPGGIMDRAHEWLSTGGLRWDNSTKTYTFPSGARLRFGYLDNERDRFQYQGGEYQYVAFDELTQFEERWYQYLFSRLRRVHGVPVPLRMRAASNPGGIGHEWVKGRFIDGAESDRRFFPAGLRDNPYLHADEYETSLMHLDPLTRAQLLRGDWTARSPGAIFRRAWFEIVDEMPEVTHGRPVRYWDLAATEATGNNDPDWTVGLKLVRDDFGTYYVQDLVRGRWLPHAVKEIVQQTAIADGIECRVRMGLDPGQAGISQVENYRDWILPGFNFDGMRETGSKFTRAQPVASHAGAGRVKLVMGGWVAPFLDELEAFTDDEKEYAHDDQVDAFSGAYLALAAELMGRGPMRRGHRADVAPASGVPKELLDNQRRVDRLRRGRRALKEHKQRIGKHDVYGSNG